MMRDHEYAYGYGSQDVENMDPRVDRSQGQYVPEPEQFGHAQRRMDQDGGLEERIRDVSSRGNLLQSIWLSLSPERAWISSHSEPQGPLCLLLWALLRLRQIEVLWILRRKTCLMMQVECSFTSGK